jgi:hypothetical protein
MCQYGEVCSPFFKCHWCRRAAQLELRMKEALVEREIAVRPIGFFTVHEPVLVEHRTVVVEDSNPGLSFLGATLGGMLGSAIINRRREVQESRKALPPKKKRK